MSWILPIIALINLLMTWLNRKQQRGQKLSTQEITSLNGLMAHWKPFQQQCVQMGCQPDGVPDPQQLTELYGENEAMQAVGGRMTVMQGLDGKQSLAWNFGLVQPEKGEGKGEVKAKE